MSSFPFILSVGLGLRTVLASPLVILWGGQLTVNGEVWTGGSREIEGHYKVPIRNFAGVVAIGSRRAKTSSVLF